MTNTQVYQWFHDDKKVEEHWSTLFTLSVHCLHC